MIQRVRQRHVAKRMMVAVCLAIGCDVRQLRTLPLIRQCIQEPARETLAVIQQALKRYRLRNRSIIKEQVDGTPRRQLLPVCARRIDTLARDVGPVDGLGLRRCQDREFDPMLSHKVQRLQVDRGFREPHALRVAPEAKAKVFDAPDHLRQLVARVGERHDHVVVALRQRRSMPRKALLAQPVGIQNRLVSVRRLLLHPGQQRGPEVETDAGVVVDDLRDAVVCVQDPGRAVGRVALRRDTLVPIVIWRGGILEFDRLQPRVFAGRLIEVAVNAKVSVVVHAWETCCR